MPACGALGGADEGLGDAQIERLHTNTQYILGELGRVGDLVQDSEIQGYLFTYTIGPKGNIKVNLLRSSSLEWPNSDLQGYHYSITVLHSGDECTVSWRGSHTEHT